ncbi:hypothetical protein HPP92_011860 [Vanilla planifolia]|uniref:Uncharacterized protein n=1 Tax=Vanilla planifolia TaxID=51239 RepID=A0A835V5F2_VANPL|nr:hypothetical protein HPP92_011860 [Vanilla planifolia]
MGEGCEAIKRRLLDGWSSSSSSSSSSRVKKGYVPVLVGRGAAAEMVYVHVKHFGLPTMAVLLEMAEEEMGKQSEGILRIPCVEAAHFRHVLKAISNGK